ncbi:MAG TPA: hydroxymethylglutaryl-CoA lyase [Steroidobacter sp.]|uniref:hydroxymethylglutaryl-CoA lyase n=1 Tax=Steroidobacter sp. TaxID=1978227 RepID=UPI002EDA9E92
MDAGIEILEVGPRDGLQIDPVILPTDTKIELISRLLAAGLKRIEVASFVNPRKVPQMADAEQVLAGLTRPEGVHFTGLVLNRRGFDRAAAAGCNEIGMVVVASDTFSVRNQGVSTEESILGWLGVARAAQEQGIRAQVTISAAFGCPFEGEVPLARVLEIATRCAEVEPFEICFADTIGVAVPSQVTELLTQARARLPGTRLRCHFHNTRNTGIANAWAAVECGVSALDASVGGIGGCPFAPAATGNIATEDLIYMLDRSGVATGVSLAGLIETTKWLQRQLGREAPGMLHKAGDFPKRALQ